MTVARHFVTDPQRTQTPASVMARPLRIKPIARLVATACLFLSLIGSMLPTAAIAAEHINVDGVDYWGGGFRPGLVLGRRDGFQPWRLQRRGHPRKRPA